MRRPFAIAACGLLATLALPVAGAFAQDAPDELRIESVEVSGHPDVTFSVSVPAHPDGPLPATAFTVTENGEQRSVEADYADSADLQVLLLIDTTGSMEGEPLRGAKQAATTFLQQLAVDARVAVLNYDTEATLVTDFSADRTAHIAAVDGLAAGGYTAMYDAVRRGIEVFPQDGDEASRVIVLLTDGEDNASESTIDEAIAELAAAEVTLHSIEYLTSSGDEAAIRDLADATGGAVLRADDADALTRVYEELAATITSRYTVRYTSETGGAVELAVAVGHEGFEGAASRSIRLPELPIEEDLEVAAPPLVVQPPVEAAGSGLLTFGALLWFVALILLTLALVAPRQRATQLAGTAAQLRGGGSGRGQRGMRELTHRASLVAEHRLERHGRGNRLNTALERAGIDLRPGEFVVLVVSAAVTASVIGMLLHGLVVALLLGIVTVIVARVTVSLLTDRRQRRFADQLAETLQLLSGSLRAGYSLMQAVDAVAREADSPSADEFGRLVVETRLGRKMEDALEAMADRMQCEDFDWVMQAIEIHREVGGDLAEVLDTVAGTIRERNQIRRQVKALSAEGRLSAYVLVALPFAIALMIHLTNPSYLGELTNGGLLGWGLITVGAVLMTVGVLWMRKIVKLVF